MEKFFYADFFDNKLLYFPVLWIPNTIQDPKDFDIIPHLKIYKAEMG